METGLKLKNIHHKLLYFHSEGSAALKENVAY